MTSGGLGGECVACPRALGARARATPARHRVLCAPTRSIVFADQDVPVGGADGPTPSEGGAGTAPQPRRENVFSVFDTCKALRRAGSGGVPKCHRLRILFAAVEARFQSAPHTPKAGPTIATGHGLYDADPTGFDGPPPPPARPPPQHRTRGQQPMEAAATVGRAGGGPPHGGPGRLRPPPSPPRRTRPPPFGRWGQRRPCGGDRPPSRHFSPATIVARRVPPQGHRRGGGGGGGVLLANSAPRPPGGRAHVPHRAAEAGPAPGGMARAAQATASAKARPKCTGPRVPRKGLHRWFAPPSPPFGIRPR